MEPLLSDLFLIKKTNMRDIFDLQDASLKKLGNPFKELQQLTKWEIFCPKLCAFYQKKRKSKATKHSFSGCFRQCFDSS